jgi:hypothetical protein
MHDALALAIGSSRRHFVTSTRQPRTAGDDPLDSIRGIIAGALISILGFWLPLALVLAL